LLSADTLTRIRFVPNPDFHGTSRILYRAWDGTRGVSGALVTVGATGGKSAFSAAQDEATIQVLPVNDGPVLANISGSVGYRRGFSSPALLAAGATVGDIDSSNFQGGQLVVHVSQGESSAIRLGSGRISGGSVLVGGVTIGTVSSDGVEANDLVIVFNANATVARVEALIRSITFRMAGGTAGQRRIQFTLTDGDTGTSTTLTTGVNVP
jgi:hypothetical protein